jgi:subtilisin family serine protease
MNTRTFRIPLFLFCLVTLLALGGERAAATDVATDAAPLPAPAEPAPPVDETALPPGAAAPEIVVTAPGDLLTTDKPVRPPTSVYDDLGIVAPGDLLTPDKPVRPPTSIYGAPGASGGLLTPDRPVRPPTSIETDAATSAALDTGAALVASAPRTAGVEGGPPLRRRPVRPPTGLSDGLTGDWAQHGAIPFDGPPQRRKPVRPPTATRGVAAPPAQDGAAPFGGPPQRRRPVRPPTAATLDPGVTDGAGMNQRVGVLVELAGAPAAEVYADLLEARMGARSGATAAGIDDALRAELAAATQAAVAANTAAQADLIAALEPLGASVIWQAQRVHNGVAVRVDADQVARLRALPGVVAVRPLTPKTPGNARSVPFIGAPVVWQGLAGVPGLTGEGVRIAIIDTGIDYLHRDFGGPGTGYKENDPTVTGDVAGFPSAKVVGGYDFAGDYYDAYPVYPASGEASELAFPDSDPMDCYGHGTHVAGTAAGYGVTTGGATYSGPYSTAVNWDNLAIGPGVAPRAQLYAVRVFDCFGSASDLLDMGIEYAVDPNRDGDLSDHVDVANMSFGLLFGVEYDTTAVAAERAAAAGVIMVGSAGNNYDAYYIGGSPANATRVLSVAATGHLPAGADFQTRGPDTMAAFSSRGLRRGDSLLKPDISAPGVDVVSAQWDSGDESLAASGTSMAAPHVTGMMALLRQLHPGWSVEELKALAMNTAAPVRVAGDYETPLAALSRGGAGRADPLAAARAPAVVYDAGTPGGVSVSFGAVAVAGGYQAERRVRLVNKGSTPVAYDVTYAPLSDLPGVEFTAGIGPQVTLAAGASATFPVRLAADASLMENRPDPSVDPNETPERFWPNEEAGLLLFWPQNATFSARLEPANETPGAVDSTAAAEVTARFEPLTGILHYTATLKSATGSAAQSLVLGWGHAGVTAAYTRTLAGGPQLAVNVPVAGQVALTPPDALLLAGGQLFAQIRTAQHPAGELRGQLAASAPLLRLPLHAAPRAAATLHAVESSLDFTAAEPESVLTRTLTLEGMGLASTNTPTETQSLVGMFELVVRSPNINSTWISDPEPDRYDSADLRYLGITSDYAHTGSISDTTVSFALAAWEPWTTPAVVEYDIVVREPAEESSSARVFNTMGSLFGFFMSLDDAFQTAVVNWDSFDIASYPLNGVSPTRYRTEAFNSSVMVLSVPATDLGLSESQTVLHYSAQSFDLFGGPIESTPEFTYDVRRPGLILPAGVEGSALIPAAGGASYTVGMNVADYIQNGARGLLLLHMHNEADAQAEVVALPFTWPYKGFLPIVGHQRQ